MLYSNLEYADMHFLYGYCNGNASAAKREYQRRLPDAKVFSRIHGYLTEFGRFPNTSKERSRHAVDEGDLPNSQDVLDIVENNPATSIRKLEAELEISKHKIWKILHKYQYYPYHLYPVHVLENADYGPRLIFSNYIRGQANPQRFVGKILFTDEAQFTRDGINNCRNEHRWATENPREKLETGHQRRFSVNCWCGILGNRIIGSYFFPKNIRLTAAGYLTFLEENLPLLLDDVPLASRQGMWFQHDGAPVHFGRQIQIFLNNAYPEKWIGRGGFINWPARSPDLTPLDYFLWGALKAIVYSDRRKPETREELMERIQIGVTELNERSSIINNTVQHILKRARMCAENEGGHFENLLK